MKLIALTGLAAAAKSRLAVELAHAVTAAGVPLTLLDNHDRPIHLDGRPTIRLPPGCACCSVAEALLSAVRRVETGLALLVVSAQAHPEALALVLDRLRGPDWTIITLALIDERTRTRLPHVADRLGQYADWIIADEWNIAALLCLPGLNLFNHDGADK